MKFSSRNGKRFSAGAAALLLTLCLTGCVSTRLTEITWKTGVRQYYADLSATTGEVFFSSSGRAYLRARECAFEEKPAFLALNAGPFSFRGSRLVREKTPERFVPLELSPEAAAILTSPGGKDSLLPSAHGFSPAPEKDFPARTGKTAVKKPMLQIFPPFSVLRMNACRDCPDSDAVFLREERSGASYLLFPLLPLTVCFDTAGSILATAVTGLWIAPALFVAEMARPLFGIRPDIAENGRAACDPAQKDSTRLLQKEGTELSYKNHIGNEKHPSRANPENREPAMANENGGKELPQNNAPAPARTSEKR